jgi:hypothetical protein
MRPRSALPVILQGATTAAPRRKTHTRTCTGEKPYACDFEECDSCCATAGNLTFLPLETVRMWRVSKINGDAALLAFPPPHPPPESYRTATACAATRTGLRSRAICTAYFLGDSSVLKIYQTRMVAPGP